MGKRNSIQSKALLVIVSLIVVTVIALSYYRDNRNDVPPKDKIVQVSENEEIVDGKHAATGLIADEGLNLVIAHCTGCHSAKLVTQNRFNQEGWIRVIRWMQETQNLWDLGESETSIVDYLTKNYSPDITGTRRAPLSGIEWYELEEE